MNEERVDSGSERSPKESLLGALETLNKEIVVIKDILNISELPSDGKESGTVQDKVSYCANIVKIMIKDAEAIRNVINKL